MVEILANGRVLVGEEPATAWRRITGSDEIVLGAERIKKNHRTRVYRLEVSGRPRPVIAKRCREKVGVLEHAVYTQILADGALRAPAFYGYGADPFTDGRLPRVPTSLSGSANSICAYWSETWKSAEQRVEAIIASVRQISPVLAGGDFDSWDFIVRGGLFGALRVQTMTEEHGAGRQLMRLRTQPIAPTPAIATALACAVCAGAAGIDGAWLAAAVLAGVSASILYLIWASVSSAKRALDEALARYAETDGLTRMPWKAFSHA